MKNLVFYMVVLFSTCNAQEPLETGETPISQNSLEKSGAGKKWAPKNYPIGYFRNPLGIPLQLSANFGELRPNHFHMGFDIRTNQRENLPVYATADG